MTPEERYEANGALYTELESIKQRLYAVTCDFKLKVETHKLLMVVITAMSAAQQVAEIKSSLTVPNRNVRMAIPDAFKAIKEFIDRETSEFANKEDYGSLSRCHDADKYLEALIKFFDDACDYCL